jgi:adiponectin receptor
MTSKSKSNNPSSLEISSKYGSKTRIGLFEEAPPFIKDNEYIQTGYRVNCNSLIKATKSLFYFHNETVNIWSHIIGTVLAIVLIFYTVLLVTSTSNPLSTLSISINNFSSFSKPLLDLENKQLTESIKTFTSTFVKDISSIILFPSKYLAQIDVLEKFIKNISYSSIDTITANNNKHNITFTINDYINELISKLIQIKNDIVKLTDNENSNNNVDNDLKKWPMFVMLSTAIFCLGSSSIFHLINTVSAKIHTIFSRLDYAGISILIAGSTYPPYFYFFHCEHFLRNAYLTFITVFAFGVFLYSLTSDFHRPQRRTFRGTLFLCLGISAGIPIINLIFFRDSIKGFDELPRLLFWYIGGISYVFGTLLFINRFPEKWKPGKFDYFGSSHQLFHICVVIGSISHYFGCLDSYYYRLNNTCPK